MAPSARRFGVADSSARTGGVTRSPGRVGGDGEGGDLLGIARRSRPHTLKRAHAVHRGINENPTKARRVPAQ